MEGKSKARLAGEGDEGVATDNEGVGVVLVAATTVVTELTELVEDKGEAGGVGVSRW